jgi:hypothetical protein
MVDLTALRRVDFTFDNKKGEDLSSPFRQVHPF